MILGDSLLVMTSLAEKEGLKGKVQMIYMDPPYGIKFGSNWQVSTRRRDVRDGKAEDATRQPEQIKAFRDTWRFHIHSYLAYMRDRLAIANCLLTETGSLLVQIGDENIHLVRCLVDEIFQPDNFVSLIPFTKTTGFAGSYLSNVTDYLLWFAKSKPHLKYRQIYRQKAQGEEGAGVYRPLNSWAMRNKWHVLSMHSGTKLATLADLTSQGASDASVEPVCFEGEEFYPPPGSHWKTTREGLCRLYSEGRIAMSGRSLRYIRFMDDFPAYPISNLWQDTGTGQFTDPKVYVVQTATKVIERCVLMTTDPGDLVLDPTCGSGTTAYVSEQWGRRWITIDTSRVALALARTRLMSARFPFYLLADSDEGMKKESELSGTVPTSAKAEGDIRKGFVYRRVPHVTLKSIANNPDIREGMSREETEAAIARHADVETLFDRPYEDPNRIRVTGPFTVESLSPHRIIAADQVQPAATSSANRDGGAGRFEATILDHLKKAGVQNTVKEQRLKLDRLDTHAGEYLHAEGGYTDKNGTSQRVAVCIGPEHGTVTADMVKAAAKEAVKGIGFDLLLVCGFAFDPHVSEEAKRYGKLTVLIVRMNPDLAMGDELLKNTGAGNLFMVFGEPDVMIEEQKDGNLVVQIMGVDVYDPTTGQVRSSSTDDIACWFIDTDYNEESFFVRHAYFTGAGEPYEKLKRALKAEIDEAAWASLYSTVSRPFPKPSTGKIAIKVINHYGDEVLKVYEV